MKVGIVIYQQSIEISPSIKGLAHFFERKDIKYKILIDDLCLSRSVENIFPIDSLISDFPLPQYKSNGLLTRIFNKFKRILLRRELKRKKYFDKKLSAKIKQENFDLIIACEFEALLSVYKSGFDLSKVIYFSLELEHVMRPYSVPLCAQLVSSCKFCIIQGKERANDLMKYLDCDLIKFKYVPVSIVPVDFLNKKVSSSEKVKIIYSGYFTDWAGVLELTETFVELDDPSLELVLHGHCPDDSQYMEQVKTTAGSHKNITFNFDYMNDEEYLTFLAGNDIGIAFYNNPFGDSPNWDNLLHSSGKIACYLWAGLAVVTNCVNEDYGPFFSASDINAESLKGVVEKFKNKQENMRLAAIELAKKDYNILNYFEKILYPEIEVENNE